jgi:hypothetical protein
MHELFIYYRIQLGGEAAVLRAVNAFQGSLRLRWPHLNTRCLRRADEVGAAQTWMEIYSMDSAPDADGVTSELQAEIEAAALAIAPWLAGARHTEVFVKCA